MTTTINGEELQISEKIETITYKPRLQDSGDLEAGTHTIVPTARPAIAGAQYSSSKTIAAPPDSRLVVERVAARLNVNIAGLGTATHVYCSVRVDVDDVDHELFNEDWTSIGSKLDAVDTHSEAKATIFALLKDGAAHTFYFLFWADAASQATIDVVQLWEAIASCGTASMGREVLRVDHVGLMSICATGYVQGSGTLHILIRRSGMDYRYWVIATGTSDIKAILPSFIAANDGIYIFGTVATDINWLEVIFLTLRSEQ